MSAVKNVMKNTYRNMEIDEFLRSELKDAGYGGVEIQKTPVGARITVFVTRPGLVIGRKGTGIKDLMAKIEQKFGFPNPQISVLEVTNPELNPNIMCNRIAQLIERGTAFRRASMWALNTIMSQGALGVEVTISGKLRTERAHFEKHTVGVVPKSGDVAGKIVQTGVSSVLTKMGLMGIQLRIASKAELPQEFQMVEGGAQAAQQPAQEPAAERGAEGEAVAAQTGAETNGQA
ncbi:30S ribosomal protein S3 [Nitrososphaera viennensis]|uniref:Small ribosomal subunit protein uS3 n=2 Tax=Nitrososphaera viennensis TaxID=1034015 RepID=A0A060HGH8_9ARCH|nr:30S ribosomal protein S3 [Nitrososphaera viennensis]AIC14703.1 30S ribosomal protein S3p [Nitrososphaera viennensis EN76]UVS69666.1 30S ribosomal protein S3 [Nitrososphaera viennensis]